ncbi:MAG: VCBS repeat-containing protein [Deltaproteobacteria bacterium]|nr:VCBS repeat-containing protein [Deltaproteobacteria bacterium]
MKKIFLFAVALIGFHMPAIAFNEVGSIQIPGMRFYSVKTIDQLPEGRLNLIAAGQIKQKNGIYALIMAFSIKDGKHKEIARETFRVGYEGSTGKTRIRSLVLIKEKSKNRCLVVVNGKAGPENREKGFIRSYLFNGGFKLVDNIVFSDPDTSYTHGYPLIQADMNGDGKNEIICGGFAGDNDRDHADIRIFSIGEDGHLSRIRGFGTNRLDTLRLRVNALTSGDLDGDGKPEIAAAGRTVVNDIERAAFAVLSDQTLTWKKLNGLGKCRYRYATATDMTGDGRPELVLGGRINTGDTSYALLDIWQSQKGDMQLISRYRFSGAGSTRLRIVEPLSHIPGRLIIGGRLQIFDNNRMRWKGFLQQMSFESGTLSPCSKPVILDKAWETRVRTMDIHGNSLIAAGFTEGKAKTSTAFISIYKLK